MARSHSYDDLDEMLVSKDVLDREDDIAVGKQKALKKKAEKQNKTPYQLQLEEKLRRKNLRIIGVIVIVFAVVLALLIGVGIWMTSRVSQGDRINRIKSPRAETSGYFYSEKNIPQLSNQGVKGALKEVYYTTDGNLAVTLNLSNGTPKDMEITMVDVRVFNDKDETVGKQKFEKKDLKLKYTVKANSYDEMYFEIDKAHIAKADDPLTVLGATLQIGCRPTDGSAYEAPAEEILSGGSVVTVAPAPTPSNEMPDIPDTSVTSAEGVADGETETSEVVSDQVVADPVQDAA